MDPSYAPPCPCCDFDPSSHSFIPNRPRPFGFKCQECENVFQTAKRILAAGGGCSCAYCSLTTLQQHRGLHILDDCIYRHKVLRINYTTYDMRRDQDSVNPQTHPDVMLLADESNSDLHPSETERAERSKQHQDPQTLGIRQRSNGCLHVPLYHIWWMMSAACEPYMKTLGTLVGLSLFL